MNESNVVQFERPEIFDNPLTQILHQEVRGLIKKVPKAEQAMLLDLKERALNAPALAIGDGKLVFF